MGGNGGSITNCYSSGDVSSSRTQGWEKIVGGLVGSNGGSITNCYSTGSVTGTTHVGGLVGDNDDTVIYSFWDIQTSGQSVGVGAESIDGISGKTTAEMQMESTFTDAGWDFVDEMQNGTDDIWWILEGQDYPRLWWEATINDVTDFTVSPIFVRRKK